MCGKRLYNIKYMYIWKEMEYIFIYMESQRILYIYKKKGRLRFILRNWLP